ncbi:glycosyltransferase family 4 protein [Verrucosispora sp. WMMA2044]|uniref:glycosyltransferase family 4 protein n=1 Tax=Verrucosispora sp. WMMA2044 TaxID=3016419 RepID=UPI00248D2FBB|nr:glycosyltransferase family 4 protein [Verrucosispora sp. WMMA2044]WBB50679.1 glycosyltransferase family 4 protein [Verrucosispora sp. WMMA2044]
MRAPPDVPILHVILPGDIDDPASPSGGNGYDRRICAGLTAAGWSVREHAVAGDWPRPSPAARAALADVLAGTPDGALVLVDGLVASVVPDVLAAHRRRLRLVALVHLPRDDDTEARALATVTAVVATSAWTRDALLRRYALPAERVHVAPPGVDPAPPAPGSATGSALLCVAAVARHKGHDVLVEALTTVTDRHWTLTCVGPLHREPEFVHRLRERITAGRLGDRIRLTGPLVGDRLHAAYAAADLLVHPSRGETYGMVVTEALARGVPVLATAVGGLPDALGRTAAGDRPGLLVPPDDPTALATALRRWLDDAALREQLRHAAVRRRDTLADWDSTVARITTALKEASA